MGTKLKKSHPKFRYSNRDSSITSSSETALLLENTTGTVTLTNTNLTGNGVPALVGTNINNLSFTGGNLISTNSTSNGVTLSGITGNLILGNGKITDSQAPDISVDNSSGTTGFFGNFDLMNPDNNYLETGPGIALINTTAGEVNSLFLGIRWKTMGGI